MEGRPALLPTPSCTRSQFEMLYSTSQKRKKLPALRVSPEICVVGHRAQHQGQRVGPRADGCIQRTLHMHVAAPWCHAPRLPGQARTQ